jgi:hypothetical protein
MSQDVHSSNISFWIYHPKGYELVVYYFRCIFYLYFNWITSQYNKCIKFSVQGLPYQELFPIEGGHGIFTFIIFVIKNDAIKSHVYVENSIQLIKIIVRGK